MFIQVIQGQVEDAKQVRDALDRWAQNLGPDASGWLGTTAGVTEDGRFIALARFDSEEEARRNSDRPEQDQWWAETSTLFSGEPKFLEGTRVVVDVISDPDEAGFVQVMQGRGSDPDRAWELMGEDSAEWAAFRPDVIANVGANHEGGAYTMAIYFTSEEAAREGERKEVPLELRARMEELDKLSIGVPEFFDLKQPWFYSPR